MKDEEKYLKTKIMDFYEKILDKPLQIQWKLQILENCEKKIFLVLQKGISNPWSTHKKYQKIVKTWKFSQRKKLNLKENSIYECEPKEKRILKKSFFYYFSKAYQLIRSIID